MASYFTVVQYVPDPLTDERMNIGVIVFDGEIVLSRFLTRWHRVRQFGGEDIGFLREFADDVVEASASQRWITQLDDRPRLNEDVIREIAGGWINSIQFTTPRGSIKPPRKLLDEVASRYLKERDRERNTPAYRSRQYAANLVIRSVRAGIEQELGEEGSHLVKKFHHVSGRLYTHRFDAVVSNGVLYSAAHGLTFERPYDEDLERDINLTIWGVRDLNDRYEDVPIAVVTVAPRHGTRAFDRAVNALQDAGADVLREDEVEDWANEIGERVAMLFPRRGNSRVLRG